MRRRWPRLAVGLFLAFSALRCVKLGASLTEDEGYMLQHYAAQPVSFIRAHYEVPNNHVLLSIILREIDEMWPYKIIGTLNSVVPMQLFCVACSTGALALTYLVAFDLFSASIALFAMTALGVCAFALLYSHMLRGYGFSEFLSMLNIWLVLQALRRRSLWAALALPLSLSAFVYLLPVNVLFVGAIGLWALYLFREERRRGAASFAARLKALGDKRSGQKLEKARRELERQRRQEQRPLRLALGVVVAAAAIGGALTLWAYAPIVGQIIAAAHGEKMSWGQTALAVPRRLRELFQVLAVRPWGQAWFAAVSAAGGWLIWRRRRRFGAGGFLALALAAVPLVFSILDRNVIPARVYLAALPAWAMVFGAGIEAGAIFLRRRVPAAALRPALCALVVLAAAPELAYFVNWNRGRDLRGVMNAVMPAARQGDDLSVVFCYDRLRGYLFGALHEQYYGFASNMLPDERTFVGYDEPYLPRRRVFFVSDEPARVREAMRLSRVDRFEAETLRRAATVGTLGLYEVDVDSGVLAAYRRAAASGDARSRADALAGLAAEDLRAWAPAKAAGELAQASRLSPEDARARYLLGYARYLSGDPRAQHDLEWVVARDTANAYARYFLADALAEQGRAQEAASQLMWYFGPDQLPRAWVLQGRARALLSALKAGRARVAADLSSPAGCERAAISYAKEGSYEKALLAFARLRSFGPPNAGELAEEGRLEALARHYCRAARLDRQALAAGAGPQVKLALANALAMRYDVERARELIEELARTYPQNASLQADRDYIARL